MSDNSTPHSPRNPLPDALLRVQAGGLRRVAHAILGDEHAAEDAVQDTWVAALERPPLESSDGRGVGAWFRQVTRRQALRRVRGEDRRKRREQAVAREEALVPVDEEVARREVLREVVDAVFELPEPYQTVVLLRYFEDLSPPAIAARTHTKVTTVDSRLFRARVLLREHLDTQSGGNRRAWALALAAWTAWPGGAAGIPVAPDGSGEFAEPSGISNATTAGGTSMQTKLLLAAGLTAAIGGGGWLAVQAAAGSDEDADRAAQVLSLGQEPPSEGAAFSMTGSSPAESRVTIESEATPESSATDGSGPQILTFQGTVLNSDDQPLLGAKVWVAQVGHPWNIGATTDQEGSFSIPLHANSGSAKLYVFVDHHESRELGFRVFNLTPNQEDVRYGLRTHSGQWGINARLIEDELDLTAESQLLSPGEFALSHGALKLRVAELKRAGAESWVSRPFNPPTTPLWNAGEGRMFQWSNPARFGIDRVSLELLGGLGYSTDIDATERRLTQLKGRAVQVEEAVRAQVELNLGKGRLPSDDRYQSDWSILDAPKLSDLGYVEGEVVDRWNIGPESTSVSISGVVHRADGDPAGHTWVRGSDGNASRSVLTDDEGGFLLEMDVIGDVHLYAGGGAFGIAEAVLAVSLGPDEVELQWSTQLNRGRELTGSLIGPKGEALNSWTVEFVAADGRWTDTASVAEDGSFALPNLPDLEGRLFLRPADSALVLHVVEQVGVGESHLEIVVPDSSLALGVTTLSVTDAVGEPAQTVDARLVQADMGRGSWFQYNQKKRFELACRAGEVFLEAGTQSDGYVDLGALWIQPDGQHELGTVALPAAERAHTPAPEDGARAANLIRADLAFLSIVHARSEDDDGPILLPPGRYTVTEK